jgi:hypothetical protein
MCTLTKFWEVSRTRGRSQDAMDPTPRNQTHLTKTKINSTQVLPFPLSQTHISFSPQSPTTAAAARFPSPLDFLRSSAAMDFYRYYAAMDFYPAKDLPLSAGTLRRCPSSASPPPGDRAHPQTREQRQDLRRLAAAVAARARGWPSHGQRSQSRGEQAT